MLLLFNTTWSVGVFANTLNFKGSKVISTELHWFLTMWAPHAKLVSWWRPTWWWWKWYGRWKEVMMMNQGWICNVTIYACDAPDHFLWKPVCWCTDIIGNTSTQMLRKTNTWIIIFTKLKDCWQIRKSWNFQKLENVTIKMLPPAFLRVTNGMNPQHD